MDLIQIFNKIGDYSSHIEERKLHLDIILNGAQRAYASFDDYVLTSMTMGIKETIRTKPLPTRVAELAEHCSELTYLYADNLVNIYKAGGGKLESEDKILKNINISYYNLELESYMKRTASEDEPAAAAYLALNGLIKPI
jgi:hypothetical protein